ncbi:MAG: type I restriction-modification enzyme R subunit C-terminal domain-containing protein, partial [Pseudomonadota bacterium]
PKAEPRPRTPGPVEPPGATPEPGPARQRIKVKLADGKARTIQHMMATSFWHPDGTPMSAPQFMEMLFGKLPEFFKNEAELRALWSAPDTRAKLLQGLAEKGFGREQMAAMQKIIDANFNAKQRAFLDFVLSHYVSEGVDELDQAKLTPLLRLRYRDSIADAVADLGKPEDIGTMFAGFQKYLYQEAA